MKTPANAITAIVVDDEELGRSLIREYLADHQQIVIVAECRDAHEAFAAITEFRPDLLFLDIQMPEINGFELLEMLDELPRVIFSTAYDRYAIRAFEVNAVDYLLKPYDAERFGIAVQRAMASLHKPAFFEEKIKSMLNMLQPDLFAERLLIKQSGRIAIVSCKEIRWIRALDDYAEIHTHSQTYLIQQSLNYLESRLNPNEFIRSHRSFIIRFDAIQDIIVEGASQHTLVLKDKTRIPLSRTGYQKLRRFMI